MQTSFHQHLAASQQRLLLPLKERPSETLRLIGNRKHLYRSGQRLLESCWGKLCNSSETARTAASSYPLMLSSGERGNPCPINLVGIHSAAQQSPRTLLAPPCSFLTTFDGSVQGLAVCSSTSVDDEQVAQQIPRAHPIPCSAF